MNYSRIILTLLSALIFSSPSFAALHQKWQNLEDMAIDKESVNFHNDSIYYAIRYNNKADPSVIYSIIQSKGDKAGVVDTYKFTVYEKIMQEGYYDKDHPAFTSKTAPKLNPITPSSRIYEANKVAMEIAGYNSPSENYSFQDKEGYIKYLNHEIKKSWNITNKDVDTHAVFFIRVTKNNKIVLFDEINATGDEENIKNARYTAYGAAKNTFMYGFNGNGLDIEFTFDYKVIKSKKYINTNARILNKNVY